MVELLLNKVLFIIFCMSVLNCAGHTIEVLKRLKQEIPDKYIITDRERIILGLSVSFIITELVFFFH